MIVGELERRHWPQVARIYQEGIDMGVSTFETEVPSWESWNAVHLKTCRLIVQKDGQVAGWAALLPISSRAVYRGVAEESIYIAREFHKQGIGQFLLTKLIEESEKQGFWTLQATMFDGNTASIRLHEKCGFRRVGVRHAIGQLNGEWKDTVLYERRSKVV